MSSSTTHKTSDSKSRLNALKLRTLTGFVFANVMVIGTLLNKYTFYTIYTLLIFLCLREFYSHVLESKKYFRIVATLVGIATYWIFAYRIEIRSLNTGIEVSLLFPVLWSLLFIWLLFLHRNDPIKEMGVTYLGYIYIVFPFVLLQSITFNGLDFDPFWAFSLLILIWANDSWAYLIGSKFGKTKLYEKISPKKSWEGFVGGLIASIIFGILFWRFSKEEAHTISLPFWIGLAVIVSVFGTIGDLIESLLKRSLGIKDSGNILPGHGGFLDRMDGFIFCLPFVSFYILLFKYFFNN